MSGKSMSRKILFFVIFASFMLAAVSSVFPAQENVKPPLWVGIYTTAGKVGLKWSGVVGAARYKVYRTVTSGKGYELAATTTDVSYIDAGVRPGETYYYALKTVMSDDRESAYSDERYIKVPLTGGGQPVKPPEWVGARVEEKSINLAWVPSYSSNAVAYNVYRSKDKNKGFQLIGSTQDTSLTDTDVKEGETYYYALTTLDKEFKETKFSEKLKVTFALPKEAPAAGPERPGIMGGGGAMPGKPGTTGGGEAYVAVPGKPGTKGGEEAYVLPEKLVTKPTRVIGYIIKGKNDLPLSSPTDIDLGPDGNLYVSDTGTSTIQVFRPSGEFIRAIGGYGSDDGKFEKLLGVTLDGNGNIYAADSYTGRIQKFDKQGHLMLSKNMAEDGKAIAEDLGLKMPVTVFGVVKVVVSPDGEICAVDNYNHCIETYSATGHYIKAFGGKGTGEGQFQGPTFGAFGADGNLYVTDCMNARVQVFTREGKFLWEFGGYGNVVGTFGRPKGIYVEDSGRIYVADSMSNVVQAFDKNGRFLFVLGDEKGRQMDLATPNGIVMDKKRRIYMVEKLINRVQIRQVGEQ